MDNTPQNGAESPLAVLLSDKELLARLSGIMEGLKSAPPQSREGEEENEATPTSVTPDALSSLLSSPDLMAKLPDVMSALTPVLRGGEIKKASPDKRTALLLALRPYMSDKRCEAIDYITRIGKLGDVMKALK